MLENSTPCVAYRHYIDFHIGNMNQGLKKLSVATNQVCNSMLGYIERRFFMAKRGVSSKTHTKQQLDAYANQHNPNNPAYKSEVANKRKMRRENHEIPEYYPDFGFGWCED